MVGISLEKLDSLFALIAENETLYLPTDTAPGIAQFKKWHSGMKMTGKLKTSRSAKDFFFPQVIENLRKKIWSGHSVRWVYKIRLSIL